MSQHNRSYAGDDLGSHVRVLEVICSEKSLSNETEHVFGIKIELEILG